MAASVNDSGRVAGTYQKSAGSTHGFTYQAGVYRSLDVPGATATFPNAINASGVIGGGWGDAKYQLHSFSELFRESIRRVVS